MLRRALAALPMGAEEKKRVERETLDERGFVTNLERLLLAVDDSPAGKFAARIAGLVAGAHGMPLTIVRIGDEANPDEPADGPIRQVKEGAEASAAVMNSDEAEPKPDKVHLTTRAAPSNEPNAIVDEARKGFDLMMVGVGKTHDAEGAFDPALTKLSQDFKGPLAILTSHGGADLPKLDSALRILVPINGTPAARRAAEVAFAVARPTGARVTALYALKDIAELGDRYDVRLRTALQPKANAEGAILKEAENVYGLIVMGVSQRPGAHLFFGNTANAILKRWKGLILFVAT
jgi:nucleotide-binding universal stress UspA family protein